MKFIIYFYYIGDLCTPAQIEAKCCEAAFEGSSGESITWKTTKNDAGGEWETDARFIRFNIANDKKCQGTATQRQTGSAELVFDNDHNKILILSMEGKAEAGYETFQLFLDGDKAIEDIKASGSSECQSSSCNMCSVTMPKQYLTLEKGKRNITVKIDTIDGNYHSGAYFKINFEVKQKDVCKACKCGI